MTSLPVDCQVLQVSNHNTRAITLKLKFIAHKMVQHIWWRFLMSSLIFNFACFFNCLSYKSSRFSIWASILMLLSSHHPKISWFVNIFKQLNNIIPILFWKKWQIYFEPHCKLHTYLIICLYWRFYIYSDSLYLMVANQFVCLSSSQFINLNECIAELINYIQY